MDVGFLPNQIDTIGKTVTSAISGGLWYLDTHHELFKSRSLTIPEPFDKFQGFNDYVSNHKKKPKVGIQYRF